MDGEGKQVNVGTETYSNISVALYLKGWISVEVFWRLTAVKEAGLWEWWAKIAKHRVNFKNDWNRMDFLVTPNMHGNILIIFVVLLLGLIIASCLFIMESSRIIYRFIMLNLLKFRKAFNYFRRVLLDRLIVRRMNVMVIFGKGGN